MLLELRITDFGIIEAVHLLVGPGLTAITGETGAGKTLITGAIALLAGERADASVVRDGAAEARVEGRFEDQDGTEVVMARVIPATGRSRAYVDGRLATASELASLAEGLLDLHAQHAHQALLEPAAQRRILDAFAGAPATVALDEYRAERAALAEVVHELAGLGGDTRMRAREISLLEFQVDELAAAGLEDPDEDRELEAEEQRLADATGIREALSAARHVVDANVADGIASAVAAVGGRAALADVDARLRALQVDASEMAHDLREQEEGIVDDPVRLDAVRARRQKLRELGRKYGADLAEVIAFQESAAVRLEALRGHDVHVEKLEGARLAAEARVDHAAGALRSIRTGAAGPFAAAVTEQLRELAMPGAAIDVTVAAGPPLDDGADEVVMLLAANPGEPAGPLARTASGGERSRALLAVRVAAQVAGAVPGGRALVFDEVDAGVGGEAGAAVGRALAALSDTAQVLCVTHLAQVAACASAQVVVRKGETDGRTIAHADVVDGEDRVTELSRMLAGVEASDHARRHAAELLTRAGVR
ncbi:MAG: DNA repair protein RecN [Acidimicrobiia bacterium]